MVRVIVCGWIILSCLTASWGQGEKDTTTYRLEMGDGNVFTGKIVSKDSVNLIFLSSQVGQITVPRSQITIFEPVGRGAAQLPYYYPQTARYFFSPNGYGLHAGEAYYQNVWVLYNQVSVGLTDHVSLGVGTIPLVLLGGDLNPVWLVPKVSIPVVKDKFQFGAGAFIGSLLQGDQSGFGIVYGTGTLGSRARNVTLGLGYGYADGEWAKNPAVSLSAMIQTGPKGYFITENYYLSSGSTSVGLISLGGRRIIRRIGLDFGGIIPVSNELEQFVVIPWLGITIPFYMKKK